MSRGGPLRQGEGLVVVHMPKTAGTSLRALLSDAFGDGLHEDYADTPLQRGRVERRVRALRDALRHAGRPLEAPCVYGHFLPLKYALARGARFVTWLRDPVQRVVSRYHHYQRAVEAGEALHVRWGLVPGLSLEAFAALPQYRDTYAEYLWGFPLRRFEFIGRVECFDADLERLCDRFGLARPQVPVRVNANPLRSGDGYAVPPATEALIRRLNPRDVAIYARACGRS